MATAAAARHHHPALVERRRRRIGGGIRCSSPVFRRRLVVGATTAAAVAVGANFGGVTSFLLGLSPELGRSLRLDVLYPVGGFTRCLDSDNGFEAMKAKYDKYWDKSSIALAVACFLDPRYKKNLVEYFAGRIYHERAAHEVNRFIDIVNKLF